MKEKKNAKEKSDTGAKEKQKESNRKNECKA